MLSAAVHWLSALRGVRRQAVAFIAGALTTAALPPFHIIPALWIALPVLLWLLEGCPSWRKAALVGWAFGFGHYLVGLNWLTNAFYIDADTFGMFALPALFGLTFGMGLFFAAVCAAAHVVPSISVDAMPDDRTRRIGARVLMFAAAWTTMEWSLSWFLTGFPWNPMATIWAERATPVGNAMLQSVSMIGTYGLSLITVAAAAMPAVLGPAPRWRKAYAWTAAPLAVLALIGAAGAVRLALQPTETIPNLNLRLVQPNIPEAEKWRSDKRDLHLYDYVAMSVKDRPANTAAVIWGESAVAVFMDRDLDRRRIAAEAAPPGGVLMTGADRAESRNAIFNSLYMIASDGRILATYDKHHLVPFGEFMPFRGLIPFDALTQGGDFSAGPGLTTLSPPGLPPLSPLICFEVIFPGSVVASGKTKPQWLLNLTNDSWFGTQTGPYQHFAIARLRAIEEGLPLVRVAGTGISAVVDSLGRVTAIIGLGERGYVDATLPRALNFTIFGLLGNFIPLLAVAATAVLARRYSR